MDYSITTWLLVFSLFSTVYLLKVYVFNFEPIADWLIERSKKTPYVHLGDYMHRFWLVPYVQKTMYKTPDGCGFVNFFRRPVAFTLQFLGIAVRVHHIKQSDKGRDYHNHPFYFITVILRGGYTEHIPEYDSNGFFIGEKSTFYEPGTILLRKPKHFHRLELPYDGSSYHVSQEEYENAFGQTWTLFITFAKTKKRDWGFLVNPDYIIQHNEYERRHNNERFGK
jgi:hypothetical protein